MLIDIFWVVITTLAWVLTWVLLGCLLFIYLSTTFNRHKTFKLNSKYYDMYNGRYMVFGRSTLINSDLDGHDYPLVVLTSKRLKNRFNLDFVNRNEVVVKIHKFYVELYADSTYETYLGVVLNVVDHEGNNLRVWSRLDVGDGKLINPGLNFTIQKPDIKMIEVTNGIIKLNEGTQDVDFETKAFRGTFKV